MVGTKVPNGLPAWVITRVLLWLVKPSSRAYTTEADQGSVNIHAAFSRESVAGAHQMAMIPKP